MGGLAGGSAFFGRRLERGNDPRRLYASLEAVIACLALLFPAQLAAVNASSAWFGRSLAGQLVALGVIRFGLAASAVAPATFLMGGTLPAMVALVSSQGDGRLARDAGVLYGINTAGAVVGATLAGFVAIERLGTYETTWVAAAANLLIAVAVIAMRRGAPVECPGARTISGAAPTRSAQTNCRAILWAYAFAGFAALALEIVWTRALVFFVGSTTYAFTSMLVVFLSGVAIGSAVAARPAATSRRPEIGFVALQALVAISSAASLRILRAAAPLADAWWPAEQSWPMLVANSFAKTTATMAIPTVLMGAAFPFAVRLAADQARRVPGEPLRHFAGEAGRAAGAILGPLYAANTAGSIAGATVAGLALVPLLGIARTLVGAALFSVAAAALCVTRLASHQARAVVVLLLVAAATVLTGFERRSLHVPVGSEQLVFYEEGRSATVSVLQEVTGTRTIYIDRVPVAGTDSIMLTDQKSLAHVPMLLNPGARRVLTVGFGSGGASWSFSRYASLERIDCVEIDPSVFHAAPTLTASNHAVWTDPRFHLILEDARHYLASTDAQYDVISTDCTDLRYKSNANLYTTDYFGYCRRRIRPGGIVTVWMPLGGLGGDTFRMALRTFRSVFPHATVWYMTNQPTHYVLLVGSDRPIDVDVDRIARVMARPEIRADLGEIRLDDPLKLASSLLLDEEETARLAGGGAVNTDRHPLLEFEAPRLAYRDALAANLRATASARVRGFGSSRWHGSAALVSALTAYVAATPPLIEGHARYQQGTFDYAGAERLYHAAAAVNPTDRSIPLLIADLDRTRQAWLDEFRSRTAAGSPRVADWIAYSTLLDQVGRYATAASAAEHGVELAPRLAEARTRYAAALATAGDERAAADELERARREAPDDPVVLGDLGAAYNEQHRFEDALAVLQHTVGLAPASADAHNNLGVTLIGLHRERDAIEELDHALALNPSSSDAWFNLGVAYAAVSDWNRARIAYGRGLALAPGDPRALYNLALIEANAGRLGEAARRMREAVDRDPMSAELRNELGRVYLRLDQPDLAVREFERARDIDPASPAIAENLRLATEMLNRRANRQRPAAR